MPPSSPLSKLSSLPAQQIALLVCIVALGGFMAVTYPDFATIENAEVIAMGFVLEGFMALGMTLVIVCGAFGLFGVRMHGCRLPATLRSFHHRGELMRIAAAQHLLRRA